MARPPKLVALVLLALSGAAQAGYALPSNPPGFGGGPGAWTYAPSANDATFGRVIHTQRGPVINTGGQMVKMPASYRLAANAPRIAAAAIYLNPTVRSAAAIAAWLVAAKVFWDEANQRWVRQPDYPQSDGMQWAHTNSSNAIFYPTKEQACKALERIFQVSSPHVTFTVSDEFCIRNDGVPYRLYGGSNASCPQGWYITPAGCTLTPQPQQVGKEEFENILPTKPMPERVPLELPQPTPLPIEQPSPWINPSPGPNPQHRPMRVPTGDPVPNPDYNPNEAPSPTNQPYRQPYTDIIPSPTPEQPWRVDLRPGNRPQPTPEPMPGPEPVGEGQDSSKPKPEEQQSLCEKHPDIVACEKLGEPPEAEPIQNEDRQLSITPNEGWGPSDGVCPAPKTANLHGFALEFSLQPICDFATGIRPVIIGLAWVSAAFIFMGIGRRAE